MAQHEMSRGGENMDGELNFRVDSANSNTALQILSVFVERLVCLFVFIRESDLLLEEKNKLWYFMYHEKEKGVALFGLILL